MGMHSCKRHDAMDACESGRAHYVRTRAALTMRYDDVPSNVHDERTNAQHTTGRGFGPL